MSNLDCLPGNSRVRSPFWLLCLQFRCLISSFLNCILGFLVNFVVWEPRFVAALDSIDQCVLLIREIFWNRIELEGFCHLGGAYVCYWFSPIVELMFNLSFYCIGSCLMTRMRIRTLMLTGGEGLLHFYVFLSPLSRSRCWYSTTCVICISFSRSYLHLRKYKYSICVSTTWVL